MSATLLVGLATALEILFPSTWLLVILIDEAESGEVIFILSLGSIVSNNESVDWFVFTASRSVRILFNLFSFGASGTKFLKPNWLIILVPPPTFWYVRPSLASLRVTYVLSPTTLVLKTLILWIAFTRFFIELKLIPVG